MMPKTICKFSYAGGLLKIAMLSLLRPNIENLREKSDVVGLVKALGYRKDSSIRASAATALGQIGDTRAVVALIQALSDEAGEVREDAARALGKIEDARAVEPLIDLVKDPLRHSGSYLGGARGTGWMAAVALGMIGDESALEPLVQALKHEDRCVRQVAAVALGELRDARAIEPLVIDLDGISDFFWKAIKALSKIDISSLLQALGDGPHTVRSGVAEALGYIHTRDTRATTSLIQTLRDREACVRVSAAGALERRGDARAIEPLICALKDESRLVRDRAAEALGKIGDARAVQSLEQAVRDGRVEAVSASIAAAAIARRIKAKT